MSEKSSEIPAACSLLAVLDLSGAVVTADAAHTTTEHGHGRRATRTTEVADVPAWIEFTGAMQIAQLRRTVTRKGKRTVEVVHLITSADARSAPPARSTYSWQHDQQLRRSPASGMRTLLPGQVHPRQVSTVRQ